MKKLIILLPMAALMVVGTNTSAEEKDKPKARPSREQIVAKYDTNGDGKLDDAERTAARADFQKNRGEGRPPAREHGDRPNREDMIKKYDKNGDGKLNDSERDALREEMMKGRRNRPEGRGEMKGGRRGFDRAKLIKEFDKDGDGKLSDAERQSAMTAMRKRYGMQGPPSRGGGPNGRPEFNRKAMMKKYDKDGDGELSEQERTALRADMEKRMEKRRPRPEDHKHE